MRIRAALLTAPCVLTLGLSRVRFEPAGAERLELAREDQFGDLVGTSSRMRRVFRQLQELAQTDLGVLITGETGTGKELAAQAIHDSGKRAGKPFVVVDCTTLVGSLAESQLFGHEKGAFTGADKRMNGLLQRADGGTLFIDEIGELSVDLQPKLLRALASRSVRRLGNTVYEPIDVRVVAATLRDLGRAMNTGAFRPDLYFRVAQARLESASSSRATRRHPTHRARRVRPPRSDPSHRRHDRSGEQHPGSAQLAGNVRELVLLIQAPPRSLPAPRPFHRVADDADHGFAGHAFPAARKRAALEAFERDYWTTSFEETGGNISEIARRSGMERHHVRPYLRKYGLVS